MAPLSEIINDVITELIRNDGKIHNLIKIFIMMSLWGENSKFK